MSLYILLLTYSVNAVDIIDSIWADEFLYDTAGLNGWNTYYGSQNTYSPDSNPIMTGNLGDYHGIYEGRDNYLIRTFQCRNDSSVQISFHMAYCGNAAGDSAHIAFNSQVKHTIELDTVSRLYLLNDALITSAVSCSDDGFYLYSDSPNPQQLSSFVTAETSFDVEIEVSLSLSSDKAAISDIAIICDPITPSPTHSCIPNTVPSNIITDEWTDDLMYDINGYNGWKVYYIDSTNEELYTPDANPFVCGTENVYHGIYDTSDRQHFLLRNFECKYDSDVSVQYSVAHCANGAGDEINVYFDGTEVSSLELETENPFTDAVFMAEDGGECSSWFYSHYITSVGSVTQATTFEVQTELILSRSGEHAGVYNLKIVCNHSETVTSATPTSNSPTTTSPTTNIPTTATPTAFPTTSIPTTVVPTTSEPTTFVPTTSVPTTLLPTTSVPITSVPTTLLPTTAFPSTFAPTQFRTTRLPTAFPSTQITYYPTTFVPVTVESTVSNTEISSTIQPTSKDIMIFSPTLSPTISAVNSANTEALTSSINMGNESKNGRNLVQKETVLLISILGSVLLCAMILICCFIFVLIKKKGRAEIQAKDTTELEKVSSLSSLPKTSDFVLNTGEGTNANNGENCTADDYQQFTTPTLNAITPEFGPQTMDINLTETAGNIGNEDSDSDDLWVAGTNNVTIGNIEKNATMMREGTNENLDGLYSKPLSQHTPL